MYKIEATFIYTKELLTLVKGNSKKFKCSNKLLTANYADCCEIKFISDKTNKNRRLSTYSPYNSHLTHPSQF